MQVVIWRPMLAELNTHRLISRPEADAPLFMEEFSRNSASSRAIPVAKQLARVRENTAFPVSWPAEQKGMQGGDELDSTENVSWLWGDAAGYAADTAEQMVDAGLHKSVTNRLIEPFMWHTVVLTATNWTGFFEQRLDTNAQPEIRVAAEAMYAAMTESTPTELLPTQWHLPYIDPEDIEAVEKWLLDNVEGGPSKERVTEALVHISTSRCARVSYLTQEGKRDITEDFALYDRLVSAKPTHFSPAEHPCRPELYNEAATRIYPTFGSSLSYEYVGPRYGNLTGWHQHRFDLMGRAS